MIGVWGGGRKREILHYVRRRGGRVMERHVRGKKRETTKCASGQVNRQTNTQVRKHKKQPSNRITFWHTGKHGHGKVKKCPGVWLPGFWAGGGREGQPTMIGLSFWWFCCFLLLPSPAPFKSSVWELSLVWGLSLVWRSLV